MTTLILFHHNELITEGKIKTIARFPAGPDGQFASSTSFTFPLCVFIHFHESFVRAEDILQLNFGRVSDASTNSLIDVFLRLFRNIPFSNRACCNVIPYGPIARRPIL